MLSSFRTYNVIVQNFIRYSIVFPISLQFCGKVEFEFSPAALRCCCRIFSHNVNTLAINPQIKCNQFKFHTSIFIRNLFCVLLMESELQPSQLGAQCHARWQPPPQLASSGWQLPVAWQGASKWFFEILNPSQWPGQHSGNRLCANERIKNGKFCAKLAANCFQHDQQRLATLLINCERKLCKTKQEISNCRRGQQHSASSGKFAAAASELLKCVRRTLTAAGLIHAQFITIKGG